LDLNRFSGLELLDSDDTRVVDVPAGGAFSIKFPIRISVLGEIPIRVTAISDSARDSVIRTVFVKVRLKIMFIEIHFFYKNQ